MYTARMDELVISGRKYISSKRGAEITGYAKDYIGQLARGGKISATRVGRTWYVLEEALLKHKAGSEDASASPAPAAEILKQYKRPTLYHPYQISDIPKTWSTIRYFDEQGALIPPIQTHTHTGDVAIRTLKSDSAQGDSEAIPHHISAMSESQTIPITVVKKENIDSRLNEMQNTEAGTVDLRIQSKSVEPKLTTREKRRFLFPADLTAVFALGILFLLVIPLSGLLVGSEVTYFGSAATHVATASVGFEYVRALLGVVFDIIGSFFDSILSSFGAFFQLGFDFILDLPSRLGEIIDFVLGR